MGQQDLRIQELVAKIERGEIRLPEMQRQYVWKSTRVRDLLDSLYRGYPSGTILTWETNEPVPTRDFSVAQETSAQTRYQLLLDGQQRLTSLSAILRGEPLQLHSQKRPIDILFNLEHPDALEVVTEVDDSQSEDEDLEVDTESPDASEDELSKRFDKMAFVVKTSKLERLSHWVSVTEVFKVNSDTPFLKKAGVTSMEDPRYDKYTQRLKKLRSIQDYTYRVHILEHTKSYEEVTEIFVRVNSLGAKLRSSDLALAQITAKWRNALETFQEYEDKCRKEGFDVGLAIHLKNLMAFATGQSRFKTVTGLAREQLQEAWEGCQKGMDFAINFLRSNAGIDSPALMASPFLMVTLAYYGHYKGYKLNQDEAKQLRYWVLAANVKARYSRGSSETFLDQDLSAIRNGQGIEGLVGQLKTQVGRLEIVPEDLENRNIRSAYFKTMFLAFRESQAQDWNDHLIISLKHSGNQHSLQFHHIFPQDVLKKAEVSKQRINDICNLAFISGKTNRSISNKEPSVYLPKVLEAAGAHALEKQAIPLDKSMWDVSGYEDFLRSRRERVAQRLNEFLGSL